MNRSLMPKARFGRTILCAGLTWLSMDGAAKAGPPFLTDDPEPVDLGHWEVYGFTQVTETRDDTSGVQPGVEVNYGLAPNLQIHLIAPLAMDHPDGRPVVFGIGDIELGAKYRFVEETDSRPQVGVFPLIELPTGDPDRGLGAGYTRAFLPVWLQKSYGDWLTYGGGGYWINPGPENKNYWFTGWLLQRQVTKPLALGVELFHETANTVDGKATTGFNVGGIYDVSDHYHLLFSGGSGLQNTAVTNRFSYYLALQYTF